MFMMDPLPPTPEYKMPFSSHILPGGCPVSSKGKIYIFATEDCRPIAAYASRSMLRSFILRHARAAGTWRLPARTQRCHRTSVARCHEPDARLPLLPGATAARYSCPRREVCYHAARCRFILSPPPREHHRYVHPLTHPPLIRYCRRPGCHERRRQRRHMLEERKPPRMSTKYYKHVAR